MFEIYILLFVLGLATSFVSYTSGGSSLINIPVMIAMGLSPATAIASGRMTAVGTSLAGIHQFHKFGKVDYKLAYPAALLSVVGAVVGSLFTTHLSNIVLSRLVGGITLTLILLSFFLRNHKKKEKRPLTSTNKIFGYSLFLITSTIGGVFGGMGIINTYIFMLCFHKSISESIGTRKIVTLTVSVAAALVYGFHGLIDWYAVFALMAGTVIGTSFGTAFILKKGDRFVTWLFNIVTMILAIKLLFIAL